MTRINAALLDGVNHFEDLPDPWPTTDRKQDISARGDLRKRREYFTQINCAYNPERRTHGPERVGSPPDESEHLARCVTFDARPTINDSRGGRLPKSKPVLMLPAPPLERHMREQELGAACRRSLWHGWGSLLLVPQYARCAVVAALFHRRTGAL